MVGDGQHDQVDGDRGGEPELFHGSPC
jgi:hypothetical protein